MRCEACATALQGEWGGGIEGMGRGGGGGSAFVLASVLLSEIHLYKLISCSLLQLTLRVLTWFDSESSCALYEVR